MLNIPTKIFIMSRLLIQNKNYADIGVGACIKISLVYNNIIPIY